MADLTYLANTDTAGSPNPFYTLAKQYFLANGSTVIDAPAAGQTLEGILEDLRTRNEVQETVNIVSRATGFGALGLPITLAAQSAGRSVTVADEVQDALAKKTLAPPGPEVIDDSTRIVIYGCDLGRSTNFLLLLSGLFGNPGELLAPRQLGLFTLDGSTAQYRQAQTWTLVSKAALTPQGADAPAEGWPAYRAQFVSDAIAKFGPAATLVEVDGAAQLTTQLTAATNAATVATGPTLFIETGIGIAATTTQTAKQVADSFTPLANGDPVTAAAQSVAHVDDSAVVTTISGADAYPTNDAQTEYSLGVVILTQLVDQDVPIAEGPAYARVTSGQGLSPSVGPGASDGSSGAGSGSGAANDLQPIIDVLLGYGMPQDQIDEMLAGVPQGDTTAQDAETDSPDGEVIAGDPDFPMPQADFA